jgi:hypothetical protein
MRSPGRVSVLVNAKGAWVSIHAPMHTPSPRSKLRCHPLCIGSLGL